jgi:hypothetical protein
LAGVAAAAMAVAAAPPTASAAGTTASVGVVTGPLTLLVATDVDFGIVQQDGADHTPTASGRYDVSDATASGAGWHLSITGTPFADASGHTLPAANAEGATSACDGDSTCTLAENQVDYPLTLATATPRSAPVALYDAAPDTGSGPTSVTFTVDMPAAVDRASIWVLTVSSSP